MLNNQTEVREFDDKISELHSTDAANIPQIVRATGSVVDHLFGTRWLQEARQTSWWQFSDYEWNILDPDDAEFLKSVVTSAITVLKSNGEKGLPSLQKSAGEYLHQRGHDVETRPSRTVTVAEIAFFLGILPTSLPKAKKMQWGDPVRGGGNNPHEWMLCKILPIL